MALEKCFPADFLTLKHDKVPAPTSVLASLSYFWPWDREKRPSWQSQIGGVPVAEGICDQGLKGKVGKRLSSLQIQRCFKSEATRYSPRKADDRHQVGASALLEPDAFKALVHPLRAVTLSILTVRCLSSSWGTSEGGKTSLLQSGPSCLCAKLKHFLAIWVRW